MFLQQYYLGCLAHASYMIADENTGDAVVVDPQRDIDQYLADAEALDFRIRYVFLTHFHADFVAGHIELRDAAGAEICLGSPASAAFSFLPVTEATKISLGRVRLEFLETPGHTPEGISIVVFDETIDANVPHAVLTGDTLFVGDVGRPDLMASIGVSAEELATQLYDSVHNKLSRLPDSTLVYPAHGAGSLCGRNLSDETVSTIGDQKQSNYAMQPMPVEQFVDMVLADQPDAPDYFSYDAELNREERATLSESMRESLNALSLEAVLRHQTRGVQIVDVRDAIDFEFSHLVGTINIGLRGKFATWAGSTLRKDRPVIVIGDDGDEFEAIMRLGRIGFDHVTGFLKNGVFAVGNDFALLGSIERVTANDAAQQLKHVDAPLVLDVRSDAERAEHIAGSLHVPLNSLAKRFDDIPRDRRLIVHCAGGYRSAIACSLLKKHGFRDVEDLVGGFSAWKASGLPTETVVATSA